MINTGEQTILQARNKTLYREYDVQTKKPIRWRVWYVNAQHKYTTSEYFATSKAAREFYHQI